MAAACIIYLSDKDEAQRAEIQKEWLHAVNIQKF